MVNEPCSDSKHVSVCECFTSQGEDGMEFLRTLKKFHFHLLFSRFGLGISLSFGFEVVNCFAGVRTEWSIHRMGNVSFRSLTTQMCAANCSQFRSYTFRVPICLLLGKWRYMMKMNWCICQSFWAWIDLCVCGTIHDTQDTTQWMVVVVCWIDVDNFIGIKLMNCGGSTNRFEYRRLHRMAFIVVLLNEIWFAG